MLFRSTIRPDVGSVFYTQFVSKHGISSLPWTRGVDAAKGLEEAQTLHILSINLRKMMMKSTPTGDIRPDAGSLKVQMTSSDSDGNKPAEWKKPAAIPTLMQLLQTENAPIRLLLIDLLAGIDGVEASTAIAQRAIYELSPEIRERAVQALAKLPAKEYRQVLLEGMRYPWPAAADHAAEAIAAMDSKDFVPDLVGLLNEPDPSLAYKN